MDAPTGMRHAYRLSIARGTTLDLERDLAEVDLWYDESAYAKGERPDEVLGERPDRDQTKFAIENLP